MSLWHMVVRLDSFAPTVPIRRTSCFHDALVRARCRTPLRNRTTLFDPSPSSVIFMRECFPFSFLFLCSFSFSFFHFLSKHGFGFDAPGLGFLIHIVCGEGLRKTFLKQVENSIIFFLNVIVLGIRVWILFWALKLGSHSYKRFFFQKFYLGCISLNFGRHFAFHFPFKIHFPFKKKKTTKKKTEAPTLAIVQTLDSVAYILSIGFPSVLRSDIHM